MEKNSGKNKSFVGGALLLGAAGLVIKLLGAAFRIPVANIIGSDGMGYYQTAYPVYVFFLTIATAGIPTAISRMVAERNAIDRPKEAFRVFKVSFGLLFVLGTLSSSVLFFCSEAITNFIHEPGAVYAMKATAPALFFCPLMASFRGFFQGRQDMRPTAASQITEQVFRVAVGLGLTALLLPKGNEYAAAGASFGATAGGLFGLMGMLIIYSKRRSEISGSLAETACYPEESTGRILKDILFIAAPITLGSAFLPIMNVIDTAIVKNRLIYAGFESSVARSLYGQLTGMASPIINFPQVLAQAVSMSLVPVIASAFKRGETDFMKKNIRLGLRFANLIGIPCALGMFFLPRPLMLMFYPYQRESAISAAGCLRILSIGVIFLSMIHALTGILQGIGKQHVPVINLCVGGAAKTVFTYILTGIPSINVLGAAFGTVAAYFTAAILNLFAVIRYTKVKVDFKLTFVKPFFSALVMGALARGIFELLHQFFGNMFSTLAAVASGVVIYGVMILMTGAFTVSELESVAIGKRVASVLKKFHK